jgi:CheY-like chemotaxis protein
MPPSSRTILNLVSNATKFTHNGEITLRARRETLADGDWIEIAVKDTGVGISADQINSLFSKFTQANARIASKYGGTGLGLSLSQNLCNLMGGDITVSSQLGFGSCFTIRLPAIARPRNAAEEQAESKAIAASPARSSEHVEVAEIAASRRRVLVVDDDKGVLELADRLLSKEGYSVVTTTQPTGALQLARTLKPEVILLDLLMPECDGWSLLAALRNESATANIPVVIMSIIDERKRALDAGAVAVVAKPIDRGVLLRTLAAIGGPQDASSKQAA